MKKHYISVYFRDIDIEVFKSGKFFFKRRQLMIVRRKQRSYMFFI